MLQRQDFTSFCWVTTTCLALLSDFHTCSLSAFPVRPLVVSIVLWSAAPGLGGRCIVKTVCSLHEASDYLVCGVLVGRCGNGDRMQDQRTWVTSFVLQPTPLQGDIHVRGRDATGDPPGCRGRYQAAALAQRADPHSILLSELPTKWRPCAPTSQPRVDGPSGHQR